MDPEGLWEGQWPWRRSAGALLLPGDLNQKQNNSLMTSRSSAGSRDRFTSLWKNLNKLLQTSCARVSQRIHSRHVTSFWWNSRSSFTEHDPNVLTFHWMSPLLMQLMYQTSWGCPACHVSTQLYYTNYTTYILCFENNHGSAACCNLIRIVIICFL